MKQHAQPELAVVMPVFNEEASVRKVVRQWFEEIGNWTENFVFLALDDGSTDQTTAVLQRLREQLGERLVVISKPNSGHGQTCLFGYAEANKLDAEWILQIDSDGQCNPEYFFRLWRQRAQCDVIYGVRTRRDDGWRRVVASWVLRGVILIFARASCVDANVPYRLMRTKVVRDKIGKIPKDFFLANVALAILLRRDKCVREGRVPIRFGERYGGEPSVALGKFGGKGVELIGQMRKLEC